MRMAGPSSWDRPDPVSSTVLPLMMRRSPLMALRCSAEVAATLSLSISSAALALPADVLPSIWTVAPLIVSPPPNASRRNPSAQCAFAVDIDGAGPGVMLEPPRTWTPTPGWLEPPPAMVTSPPPVPIEEARMATPEPPEISKAPPRCRWGKRR